MLGLGHPSDWCPLNPCQGRGQARLRVYMCRAAPRSAVVLRSQTGLTANMQAFRIRRRRDGPSCNAVYQRWSCGAAFVVAATSSRTRAGRRRGPAGPKSGRPGDRERATIRKLAQLATESRCAALGTARFLRGAFACAEASQRGALCAPLKALEKVFTRQWPSRWPSRAVH
jgi:hypothetical protein